MTNMEATYFYRASVKRAFARYKDDLDAVHEAHGRPIPPTIACGKSMQVAWNLLVLRLQAAGDDLDNARSRINDQT